MGKTWTAQISRRIRLLSQMSARFNKRNCLVYFILLPQVYSRLLKLQLDPSITTRKWRIQNHSTLFPSRPFYQTRKSMPISCSYSIISFPLNYLMINRFYLEFRFCFGQYPPLLQNERSSLCWLLKTRASCLNKTKQKKRS